MISEERVYRVTRRSAAYLGKLLRQGQNKLPHLNLHRGKIQLSVAPTFSNGEVPTYINRKVPVREQPHELMLQRLQVIVA
jgi:hypothetical protein